MTIRRCGKVDIMIGTEEEQKKKLREYRKIENGKALQYFSVETGERNQKLMLVWMADKEKCDLPNSGSEGRGS